MLLQCASGRRSLAAALFFTFIFGFYLLKPFAQRELLSTDTPQTAILPPQPFLPETPRPESSQSSPSESIHQFPSTLSSEPETPRCAVKKVSMLYGAHTFAQLETALDLHRLHSERWGSGFASLDRDLTGRKLYSKHYFLMSTMLQELAKPAEERHEWLLWVDADSMVINPALSPCVFLPPEHLVNVYALVTADHNGLNNGIFYLRVHPSSVDLLTKVIDYPLAHPEDDLGWFGEQAAMAKVITAIEADHQEATNPSGIVWVPRKWINNYEFEHAFEGEPGSFMVHFAGLAETRLAHMAAWIDELKQNQVKWEMPVENTPLGKAIPEFWQEYALNTTGHH